MCNVFMFNIITIITPGNCWQYLHDAMNTHYIVHHNYTNIATTCCHLAATSINITPNPHRLLTMPFSFDFY